MTAKDAISPQIAPLSMSMAYADALQSLRSGGRRSLPVVDREGIYVGMFTVSDDAVEPDVLRTLVADHVVPMNAVRSSYPVTMLLGSMVSEGLEVVPVVDDSSGVYVGAADALSVLDFAVRLFPQLQESTELTVTCAPGNYSASAIAHAVEDADAHLLNLNVVEGTEPQSRTTVLLRVNHSRGESVARSLARYGYDTIEMSGTGGEVNAGMMERVNELLHYLEV